MNRGGIYRKDLGRLFWGKDKYFGREPRAQKKNLLLFENSKYLHPGIRASGFLQILNQILRNLDAAGLQMTQIWGRKQTGSGHGVKKYLGRVPLSFVWVGARITPGLGEGGVGPVVFVKGEWADLIWKEKAQGIGIKTFGLAKLNYFANPAIINK